MNPHPINVKTADVIPSSQFLYVYVQVEGFKKLIQNNMDQLEQKGFDQAAKVWSGYDIVVRMKEYGIGPQHVDQLGVSCEKKV